MRGILRDQRKIAEENPGDVDRTDIHGISSGSLQARIVTGVRRCGKSTLLKQWMRQVPGFYFMTFEDLRLTAFEPGDFQKALEVFREEFEDQDFFFFDEIQNVEGWEIFVRSLLDHRKQVFITGSNASLLSGELGTRLTGRHSDTELFPFSFQEYVRFSDKSGDLGTFMEFLFSGGFPEFLENGSREYLQTLLADILYRDIAVRRGIRNVRVMKEMAVYLFSNIGKEFSYHALKNTFELGAVSTVIDYLAWFEESYLLYSVPRFDFSLKKQAYHPKKIYAVDNGMTAANSLSFSPDTGRMLENLVFMMLRRKYREIYYFRNRNECDFVVRTQGSIRYVLQVCASLNPDNIVRETEGLTEALEFFNLPEGFLLTLDETDDLTIRGKRIRILPARNFTS